ncbi:hypothetical protein ANO11243_058620 [Dothideomycetidae sp. 11243]|nr:hypothetical protein ANO11243_058620 [fungal sp. No.11243]
MKHSDPNPQDHFAALRPIRSWSGSGEKQEAQSGCTQRFPPHILAQCVWESDDTFLAKSDYIVAGLALSFHSPLYLVLRTALLDLGSVHLFAVHLASKEELKSVGQA